MLAFLKVTTEPIIFFLKKWLLCSSICSWHEAKLKTTKPELNDLRQEPISPLIPWVNPFPSRSILDRLLPAKSIIFLFNLVNHEQWKKLLTLLSFRGCEVFVVVAHFVLQVYFFQRGRKRSFDWPNSLLHFRYQKVRYFHSTRHRTYQNFCPMSHLINPHPDRVHVGKTMTVILCFDWPVYFYFYFSFYFPLTTNKDKTKKK